MTGRLEIVLGKANTPREGRLGDSRDTGGGSSK